MKILLHNLPAPEILLVKEKIQSLNRNITIEINNNSESLAFECYEQDLIILEFNTFKKNEYCWLAKCLKFVCLISHYQEALEAISSNAFDCLLKPVEFTDIKRLINRADECNDRNCIMDLDNRLAFYGSRRLAVPTNYGLCFVNTADILFVRADSSYCELHLAGNQKVIVCKHLAYLEEQLNRHSFVRVHKSYLVNINCITHYYKGKSGSLIVDGKISIPVSSSKKRELLQHFCDA